MPAESLRSNTEADPDSDDVYAHLATLIGRNKRVLALGGAVGRLVPVLRDRGCQVVAVDTHTETTAADSAEWRRLILGDGGQTDLGRELNQDQFDVAVTVDLLEYLKEPLSALGMVKTYLRQDGYLVASVRNVAHGNVRLALLSGSFPYSDGGLLDRAQLRFYTRETMEQLFTDAEFAIGRLERQTLSIEASAVPHDWGAVPSDLMEALARDPEALTCRFVVVAYPMPRSDLRFIQRHIAELTRENEDARNRIRELIAEKEANEIALVEVRQAVDDHKAQLDAVTARISLMSDREAELRLKLLEARDQLMRREEDLQLLNKEAEQRLATVRELQGQIQAREVQLESAQAELARRDALVQELRVAVEERTAWAERMIKEAEQRLVVIHDLQGQLDAMRADRR